MLALGETLADGLTEGLTLEEGEADRLALALGDTEAEGLTEGLTLALGLTDLEGEGEGDAELSEVAVLSKVSQLAEMSVPTFTYRLLPGLFNRLKIAPCLKPS